MTRVKERRTVGEVILGTIVGTPGRALRSLYLFIGVIVVFYVGDVAVNLSFWHLHKLMIIGIGALGWPVIVAQHMLGLHL